MAFRILILLVISVHQKLAGSVSISGEISENITFLHKTFRVPPSTRAIIEVDGSYPESSVRRQGYNPMIGIYTTEDHVNIKKHCTQVSYGQVISTNLHRPIRIDESDIRPPKCLKEGLDTIHCRGNITIQDFKPRKFSFSFEFYCDRIRPNSSLQGLAYNISLHGQSNETSCIVLSREVGDLCSQFYSHGLLPNLIGIEDLLTVWRHWNSFRAGLSIYEGVCYQHLLELACYVVVPKCDPGSRQVIHPCREMCHDFRTACSKITLHKTDVLSEENIVLDLSSVDFDCDYLPSLHGDIQCHYNPVTCKSPPVVKNAVAQNMSMDYKNYSALDTVEYSCNRGFLIESNKKITCMFIGEWSTPPKCSLPSSSTTPLVVVLPVLLIPLLILITIIIVRDRISSKKQLQPDMKNYHQFKFDTILTETKGIDRPLLSLKRKPESTRNSFFDAFVLYHFDSDDDFVVNSLLPELEEARDFKLCVHSRNFTPGRDIIDNIEQIEGSNSAIIVMSQGFVDSMWCKEGVHTLLHREHEGRSVQSVCHHDAASRHLNEYL